MTPQPADNKRMPKTIVIVEDDADIRALLDLELRASGYDTLFAHDGMSAVSLIRKTIPDLILLDIGLPAGDGFSVMERLQRFPALQSIPIIVISARTTPEARERALAAGARTFIEKPFDAEAMLEIVAQALMPSSVLR